MRKVIFALAIAFCSSAESAYLYQPNFAGNSNSNNVGLTGAVNNLLSVAGWNANYTTNGTVQPTTRNQTNEFIQSGVSLLTQCSLAGNVMRNQKAILWTENFAVTNVDVQKLSEVMFYVQNQVTNTRPRLALRAGGNWYASVDTYENQVANVAERTTLTAANLAAMSWYPLNFVSGSSLKLNTATSTAFSALSGAVNAAGLYYDTTSTNYVRLREFTVAASSVYTLTVNGSTGGCLYTNGQQVAITANTTTSRNFVAWIGDTNVLSSNTVSTTVTMPSKAAALSATYDKTSLTVNSGTGGGLYTNRQQVAIAASNVPGKVFVAWTGATQYVASVASATTTVTVPVQDIALTATYTAAIPYQPNAAGNTNANSLGYGTGASSNQLLATAGWKAHYTANATPNKTTQNLTNEFVQSDVALLTDCSKTGNVWRSQKGILWTDNFAVTNIDVQNLVKIMFYQNNDLTSTVSRLALRIGENWYASSNTYQQAVGGAMERTILTPYKLAATRWYPLNFTPGSTLALNTGSSVVFSNLSGNVDAAGLYYDTTSSGMVRLREFSVCADSSTPVDSSVLFEKEVFWQGMNGYDTFRIPAMIQAPDGTMLAFAEGRVNSSSDLGNIDTVLRRSHDGGVSWEDLQVVWNDSTNTCGNPTVLVDQITSRIWLFMTHNLAQDTQDEISAGTSDGIRTIWSCSSDDNGATWSVPTNRFSQVQPADTRWDATGPGNGIQLVLGPYAGRLIIPAIDRNIQSDDHGATWGQSGFLPYGSSESSVAELNDGHLLRNNRSVTDKAALSRITSESANYGATWSALKIRYDLPCPICQASMIAHERTPAGYDCVLFSNPSKVVTTNGDRLRMTVKKSTSNADVFEHAKMIFPRNAAYSSLASASYREAGILYENGDDGWPYSQITFAKFSPEWIEDPGLLSFNFEQYTQGQLLSTATKAIPDQASYGFSATAGYPIEVVPGKGTSGRNSAIRLTGSGDGLRISDLDSRFRLNLDRDMSFIIRTVFRTTGHSSGGISGSGHLIGKEAGQSQPSWYLSVEDGKAKLFLDDGNITETVWSDTPVSDGQWQDIVVLRDVPKKRIYMILNGRLAAEEYDNTQGDFSSASTSDLAVGFSTDQIYYGSKRFIGDIDEVKMELVVATPVSVAATNTYTRAGTTNWICPAKVLLP